MEGIVRNVIRRWAIMERMIMVNKPGNSWCDKMIRANQLLNAGIENNQRSPKFKTGLVNSRSLPPWRLQEGVGGGGVMRDV